jgi:hypothetical protein
MIYHFHSGKTDAFSLGRLPYGGFISQQSYSSNAISRAFRGCYHCARVITFREDNVLGISRGTLPDSFEHIHK